MLKHQTENSPDITQKYQQYLSKYRPSIPYNFTNNTPQDKRLQVDLSE